MSNPVPAITEYDFTRLCNGFVPCIQHGTATLTVRRHEGSGKPHQLVMQGPGGWRMLVYPIRIEHLNLNWQAIARAPEPARVAA